MGVLTRVQPLDFRLLGPLEVVRDGETVGLGPPQRRALLTYLLLQANEVVPRSRLVDALWGERPPERAATALQVHVHGLRKALGAERIETRGRDYLLHVGEGELDLDRFRGLLAAGRVHEALALWRGPALAGAGDAAFLDVEAGRLEELRLAAVEERIAADLAAGAGAELVDELEALAAEHPFRESVRALLMTALYRAGRQADALAAYRDARRTLVEELGLEPGPELQALEARILRQDPALLPQPAGRLPAPPTSFVGRERELDGLAGLLAQPDVRLVTLTGPGGTGKTRLALAAAGRARPDAVFVDLLPAGDADGVLTAVAAALGVAESRAGTLLDDVLEHLRSAPALLLLDNFEHVVAAAPVVTELLRGAPALTVLATSRAALRASGEHEYPVPPLAEEDAVALFDARARAVAPDFDAAAPAVAAICRRLDSLPLAIELAAARTKLFPPELLLERLDDRLTLLSGPVDVPERQRTLRGALDWSHGLLAPAEQELFRRLGVFAGSFTVADAEAVCGAGVDELAALVDQSLVRRLAGGRLALLETIREYALELLAASGEEGEQRRRHAAHLLGLAEAADAVTFGGDQAEWWARLDLAHDDLRAALSWAAEAGESEQELRLGAALWSFWNGRGHWREGRRRLEAALARGEDAAPGTRARAAAAAGALAYRQGDLATAEARYEEAHVGFLDVGDRLGEGRMLGEFGNLAVARGEYELALGRYEEARALFRELGLDSRVGKVTANMGAVANIRRDFARGSELLREALELQRAAADHDGAAISLHNLARAELQLGRRREAARLLAEGLEAARELGYRELIAYSLEGIAEVGAAGSDPEPAARLAGAGSALLDELGVALGPDDAASHEAALAALRRSLGQEGLDAALERGAALPVDEAVELALAVARSAAAASS
jgi:predicted ATPase/DNA-binding SARP family transcriptional activator